MECGYNGVGIRLARVYDSATPMFAEKFIIYMTVILPLQCVLVADILGTVFFH
jgi:hypothetical protein